MNPKNENDSTPTSAPAVRSGDGLACDGLCAKTGHCEGTVQTVEVLDITGHKWGQYDYCATARATDRANGYTVTLAG